MLEIYVDSNFIKFKNLICCHMFPGENCSMDEFLEFSINELGLKKEWLQFSNKGLPHFDISLSKRKLAIEKGVKIIKNKDMIDIIRYWRKKKMSNDTNYVVAVLLK